MKCFRFALLSVAALSLAVVIALAIGTPRRAYLIRFARGKADFVVDVTVVNESDRAVTAAVSNARLARTYLDLAESAFSPAKAKSCKWPHHWVVTIDGSERPSPWRLLHEVRPGETLVFPAAVHGRWGDTVELRPLRLAAGGAESAGSSLALPVTSSGAPLSEPARLSVTAVYDGKALLVVSPLALKEVPPRVFGDVALLGDRAYVAEVLEGALLAFPTDGSPPQRAEGLDTPLGVATDATTGEVYVSDLGASSIARYDGDLRRLGEIRTVGRLPAAMATSDGVLFAVTAPWNLVAFAKGELFGQSVEKIDVARGKSLPFFHVSDLRRALSLDSFMVLLDLACDGQGRLHLLVGGRTYFLVRLDGEGKVEAGLELPRGGALSFSFTARGDLLLADLVGCRLLLYGSATLPWGVPEEGGFGPSARLGFPGGDGSGVLPERAVTRLAYPLVAAGERIVVVEAVAPRLRLFDASLEELPLEVPEVPLHRRGEFE